MESLYYLVDSAVRFCGWWGIAAAAVLFVSFIIQMWYWLGCYGRIPAYRSPAPEGASSPGISVAVVLHETDWPFVEETLPLLLGQNYGKFEIVVIDLSGDVEFGEHLTMMSEHDPRLSVTRMVRDARFPISDKMALNVAVKTARYDNVLLTTSDSRPATGNWLARMGRGFASGDLVLGYCGMTDGADFASRMIRLGQMGLSMRWIARAIRGGAYRGVIQNIGFDKRLYFEAGGFNYLNLNAGEDDLFIQRLLLSARVSVVVTPSATVRRGVWGGLEWWYSVRKFRSSTFQYYPRRVRAWIGTELWSRALFFVSAVAVCCLTPLPVALAAAGIAAVRFAIVMFEMRRITSRLNERGLLRCVPLYDLASPLWEAVMAVDRRFRKIPGLWR